MHHDDCSSNYCDTPDIGSGKKQHKTITAGMINERPCNMLLDIGTTHSIVHSDYVSEDDIIDGHTTIRCTHGDMVTYPIAAVVVKIGNKILLQQSLPNLTKQLS